MKITLGLDGVKITTVPDRQGLNEDNVYYVYEWFIKDDNRIFYVGKGKGNRYKQDKNDLFTKIKNNFDCDVRFVKENLSEYEALVLEEDMIQQRVKEGHVLANVVVIGGSGSLGIEDKDRFMVTPKIWVNRVDKYYFGVGEYNFDEIEKEKLLSTHIHELSTGGLGGLYFKEKYPNWETVNNKVKELVNVVNEFIVKNNGKNYKTLAKKAKSIIYYGHLDYETFLKHKENGLDVYHLIDVLEYIDYKRS